MGLIKFHDDTIYLNQLVSIQFFKCFVTTFIIKPCDMFKTKRIFEGLTRVHNYIYYIIFLYIYFYQKSTRIYNVLYIEIQ